MFYQLDSFGSDRNHQTTDVSVIGMLLFVASWQSQHLSFKKQKNQKQNFPLEMVSDQINVRLNAPLIRPFPSWSDLWLSHPQTRMTSDHTIPRPKWPLIIASPDRSDLWAYYCALEPNLRPCNFGMGRYRVHWTWSDQRSLPDGTSTWELFNTFQICLINRCWFC